MARGRGGGVRAMGSSGRSNSGRRPGSNSAASRGSSRVLPPIAESIGARPQADCCALCSNTVGDDAVGCDRCDRWYHPSVMCMGIPEGVIDNIRQYGGDGISYICTVCRTTHSSGSDSQSQSIALGQLLQTVAKLCESVQKLSDRVDGLLSRGSNTAGTLPNSDEISALISEECREIEERKKRQSSIIIRGVNVRSVAELNPVFDELSTELLGSAITLGEAVCIDADKGLFRARIADSEARRRLLDSSKNLKNSRKFSAVYINRDLTFKQRQTLIARRLGRRDRDHNDLSPE